MLTLPAFLCEDKRRVVFFGEIWATKFLFYKRHVFFYGLIWAGRRAVGLNVITNDVSQINTIWAGSTYFENINWAEL